jgi:hypothetical protein
MASRPARDGPQAGRDPATKPKQFRITGKDTTTGKKVTILRDTDLPTGTIATGIDETSGKTVTFKVSGREPAT